MFFADEKWRSTRNAQGNRVELAVVAFNVEIGGQDLGMFDLEFHYRSYRNVKGRATTDLRLGPLAAELRRTIVIGWFLLIERGAGSHRLVITPTRPA